MLGLLDVHWSLKFARLIHGFLLTIKSRCVALKLFTVMQYWDKCIINFKEINKYSVATRIFGGVTPSVEDLVPIPSEFEGISDTMCDVHLVNNPTPLEAKDHFEIVTKSNDDISFSDDDSLYNENIEYVEASPHDSEFVSLEVAEIVIQEVEEIEDDNLQISSGSTTTHFDISLPDYKAFSFNNDHIKEISSGSTTTHSNISLSEYDSFTFDLSND
nr:hypothetical protein [Tanacetum cinerariifolium]